MATVKRWAIIENGVVVNVIMADEDFIKDNELNAVEDNFAHVYAPVNDDGVIQYAQVSIPEPLIEEPIVDEVTE